MRNMIKNKVYEKREAKMDIDTHFGEDEIE